MRKIKIHNKKINNLLYTNMPKRLTLVEQRRLYKSLPKHRKDLVHAVILKKHRGGAMKGAGFMDIVKSVGSALGHLGKEIGPQIIKEVITAVIKKKISGSGITLPGGALKLAGQGRRMTKGRPKKYKY